MNGERDIDPRGLIAEAYRIEGIAPSECRSIFLDWALGLRGGATPEHVRLLLARHGPRHPDHPMTAVLREGLEPSTAAPGRRGGRGGRARRP